LPRKEQASALRQSGGYSPKTGLCLREAEAGAPGSIKKDYRRGKIVENYKRIVPALRKKGVGTYFQDEKMMELMPRLKCVLDEESN